MPTTQLCKTDQGWGGKYHLTLKWLIMYSQSGVVSDFFFFFPPKTQKQEKLQTNKEGKRDKMKFLLDVENKEDYLPKLSK